MLSARRLAGEKAQIAIASGRSWAGVVFGAIFVGGVERLIQEAIEFHLEGMREEGIAVPAPSSFRRGGRG